MSSSKFEHLWRVMSEHDFKVEGEVPKDVVCSICSKLMIEPYAAECGCQFCAHCIRDYLKGDARNCPGPHSGCSEECLEIDVNVFKDVRTNNIIKKVQVICPNEKCSFITELEKIEEHLGCCPMKPVYCPFVPVGCSNGVTIGDCINEHLTTEVFSHSRLLVELINNLTLQVDELRHVGEIREKEVKELREEGKNNNREMGLVRGVLEEFKMTVEAIKQEISSLKAHGKEGDVYVEDSRRDMNEKDLSSISSSLQNAIKEMKEEVTLVKTEMKLLQLENMKGSLSALKSNVDHMDKEIIKMKEDQQNNKNIIEDLRRRMNVDEGSNASKEGLLQADATIKIETGSENINFQRNLYKPSEHYLSKNDPLVFEGERVISSEKPVGTGELEVITRDFVWMINDISKRVTEASSNPGKIHYSDPFCKYNYKCCMCSKITELQGIKGNLYFEIYAIILRGDRDNKVEWPMKDTIEISIVNQNTMIAHKVGRYCYDTHKGDKSVFIKPMKDANEPIGGLSITVKDLRNIEGLLFKETVMVSCSILGRPR